MTSLSLVVLIIMKKCEVKEHNYIKCVRLQLEIKISNDRAVVDIWERFNMLRTNGNGRTKS